MRLSTPQLLATLAALAAIALGVIALRGRNHGYELQAEFTSSRGLVEGNDVREQGAPAGSISKIELTDRGTALVTMRLHDGLPRPRADAMAAIRPVDLLGDNYLSLSPGHDPEPLRGRIGTARTSDAPRLDELLRAFAPQARTGLQALIVESGLALDRRGVDVNRAVVALRPALEATDRVLREVGSQNAALSTLIVDAQRVSGQLGPRRRDLGRLVGAFARTVRATAARRPALDRGLQTIVPTLTQLRGTSTRLAHTAAAAQPLASSLRDAAPGLATAAVRLRPFLTDAKATAARLSPTLARLRNFLRAGAATFTDLAQGTQRLDAAAPATDRLLTALVPAAPAISEGFFVNFPDQAAEPGNQPFDPFADPRRHYWRGAGVLSCETFGVKVAPGCLTRVLALPGAPHAARGRHRGSSAASRRLPRVPRLTTPSPRVAMLAPLLRRLESGPYSLTMSDLMEFLLG